MHQREEQENAQLLWSLLDAFNLTVFRFIPCLQLYKFWGINFREIFLLADSTSGFLSFLYFGIHIILKIWDIVNS